MTQSKTAVPSFAELNELAAISVSIFSKIIIVYEVFYRSKQEGIEGKEENKIGYFFCFFCVKLSFFVLLILV